MDAVKPRLRAIQDQWDEIGHVPSAHVGQVEGRMRAVEDAVRQAEEREWKRSNPETRARAEGMLGQLEEQLDRLKADIEKAESAGNSDQVQSLRETLATKTAWLDQIRSSME